MLQCYNRGMKKLTLFLLMLLVMGQTPYDHLDQWYQTKKPSDQTTQEKNLWTAYIKEIRKINDQSLKKSHSLFSQSPSAAGEEIEQAITILRSFFQQMAQISLWRDLALLQKPSSVEAVMDQYRKDYEEQRQLVQLQMQGRLDHPIFKNIYSDIQSSFLELQNPMIGQCSSPASFTDITKIYSPLLNRIQDSLAVEHHRNSRRLLIKERMKKLSYTHLPVSSQNYLCWMRSTWFHLFHHGKQNPVAFKQKLEALKERSVEPAVKNAIDKLLFQFDSPDNMLKVLLRGQFHLLVQGQFPKVVEDILRLISYEILAPTALREKDQNLRRRKEVLRSIYHAKSAGDSEMIQQLTDYFFDLQDPKGRIALKDTHNPMEPYQANRQLRNVSVQIYELVRHPQGEVFDFDKVEIPLDYGQTKPRTILTEENALTLGPIIDSQGGHFELDVLSQDLAGEIINLANEPYQHIFAANESLSAFNTQMQEHVMKGNFFYQSEILPPPKITLEKNVKQLDLHRIEAYKKYIGLIAKAKSAEEIFNLIEEAQAKKRLINSIMGRSYYELLLDYGTSSKEKLIQGKSPDLLEAGRVEGFFSVLKKIYQLESDEEIQRLITQEKEHWIHNLMGRKYYNLLIQKLIK
jgi:hypothetical protein